MDKISDDILYQILLFIKNPLSLSKVCKRFRDVLYSRTRDLMFVRDEKMDPIFSLISQCVNLSSLKINVLGRRAPGPFKVPKLILLSSLSNLERLDFHGNTHLFLDELLPHLTRLSQLCAGYCWVKYQAY